MHHQHVLANSAKYLLPLFMMKLFKRKRRYMFGSTRSTVTVKVFSKRIENSRDRELFIEFFMRDKKNKWTSVGLIPLLSLDDMNNAVTGACYQIKNTLFKE